MRDKASLKKSKYKRQIYPNQQNLQTKIKEARRYYVHRYEKYDDARFSIQGRSQQGKIAETPRHPILRELSHDPPTRLMQGQRLSTRGDINLLTFPSPLTAYLGSLYIKIPCLSAHENADRLLTFVNWENSNCKE